MRREKTHLKNKQLKTFESPKGMSLVFLCPYEILNVITKCISAKCVCGMRKINVIDIEWQHRGEYWIPICILNKLFLSEITSLQAFIFDKGEKNKEKHNVKNYFEWGQWTLSYFAFDSIPTNCRWSLFVFFFFYFALKRCMVRRR